jgi:hypothetical protein
MLRDTFDDVQAGYYNIPREVLRRAVFSRKIFTAKPAGHGYRAVSNWHASISRQGRHYLARVENPRCRLAGLPTRPASNGCWIRSNGKIISCALNTANGKASGTGLQMGLQTLSAFIPCTGRETCTNLRLRSLLRKS